MPGQETYRMTLFKIPDEEDQRKLLSMYEAMPQKAQKVRLGWEEVDISTLT